MLPLQTNIMDVQFLCECEIFSCYVKESRFIVVYIPDKLELDVFCSLLVLTEQNGYYVLVNLKCQGLHSSLFGWIWCLVNCKVAAGEASCTNFGAEDYLVAFTF